MINTSSSTDTTHTSQGRIECLIIHLYKHFWFKVRLDKNPTLISRCQRHVIGKDLEKLKVWANNQD